MKKILIINSGSSSIKYKLIDMPEKIVLAKGLIGRLGIEGGYIKHQYLKQNNWKFMEFPFDTPNHKIGLKKINTLLLDLNIIDSTIDIYSIGHRVVHGGNKFTQAIKITKKVKDEIRLVFPLAPLHNPANLLGIEVASEIFPKAEQFAVFDTAYHQNIPEKAYRFALPNYLYKNHHIRSYGFHGISHQYVATSALNFIKKKKANIISLHLGNGASIAAIKEGTSIDTTMGFSPNSGLLMGSRSGDIDSTIIFYLLNKGYTSKELFNCLNKKSGMIGICGRSDMRDIRKAYDKGEKKAHLAYEIYAYRIKKYIGAYSAIMNGIDAIIFTGGVGEHDDIARSLICKDLDFLGIHLDENKNTSTTTNYIHEIQKDTTNGSVKILIISTDEEMQMAKEIWAILKQ
jgi:acetate kinase